jgi:hypothetical protein
MVIDPVSRKECGVLCFREGEADLLDSGQRVVLLEELGAWHQHGGTCQEVSLAFPKISGYFCGNVDYEEGKH